MSETTKEQAASAILASGILILIACAEQEASSLLDSTVWQQVKQNVVNNAVLRETLEMMYEQTQEQAEKKPE